MEAVAGSMWKVQSMLHKGHQLALPVILLAIAATLLIYRHMTQVSSRHDAMKMFLALILVQLLPLFFLQMKLLRASDPLALLSEFGPKVLLMHSCFLGLRVMTKPFCTFGPRDGQMLCFNIIGLVGSFVVLRSGFNFKWCPRAIAIHYDVWLLALLAIAGGTLTEVIEEHVRPTTSSRMCENIISTSSDYIEIAAFVPAVWMIARKGNSDTSNCTPVSDPRMRVVYFFAFLVVFYFLEDVVAAVSMGKRMPLVAGGYTVHYLMLCDVAVFLLAHIYKPKQ
eukprot:NODE_13832_length_1144_cov_3.838741.p1 GENE.NODE_13832_length_1144_cov_3.838741~~NODE_13832_length_1144_cov_3.838741.p1  ORF type:complete len:318 (+),score=74.67 NODE_13832_length_1144_cov_3.838741:115-954(+)